MIRLASWIIAALVIAAGIAWLISLPGTVTIDVAGLRMQPRLGTAVFILLAALAVGILVWSLLSRLIGAPRYFARRMQLKRREQGVEALSDAFVALQGGDANLARQLAREAQAKLPGNSAAQLLEARADLALGDMGSARAHYRALIADRKTAVAALAGLYEQARTQGRSQAALAFAKKAVAIAPQAGWASEAVFGEATGKGRWTEALAMVAHEPANSREERARKRRRQAVLETARARDLEPTEPLAALDHALAAIRLLPDFVPAALIAARIHAHRGEARKAASLLRRVWRATAHPEVATLYAHATPGVSAVERLKRVRELIDVPPPGRGAALVLARAAIDAYEWSLARNALANFSSAQPSQGVCLLMAEIEEGQYGDQGQAREWLARAVHAPADPAWTADGIVAEEWLPVSPVSGRLDAFEWKVPVSAAPGRAPALPAAPAEGDAEPPAPALAGPAEEPANPLARGAGPQ